MNEKTKTSTADQLKNPGFLGELWEQFRLVFKLLRDPDVPIYLKALPFVGVAYLLFPIDFISDFVPVLGQLDDLTILIIGAKMFIELAPQDVIARYIAEMRGLKEKITVVDGVAADAAADAQKDIKLLEGEIVENSDYE